MKRSAQTIATALVLWTGASLALADGMLVPTSEEIRVRGHWSVKYHRVKMKVRDQIASVTIDQEFVNTGKNAIEVKYMFPVPPNAAIDAMTLVVNGQEFTGKVLEADKARKIYEDIVRSKKDPALLEYVGFGLVQTRAFPLEPGKPCKILIHYDQKCPKDNGMVECFYPLNTEKFSARKIDDVSVTLDIKSKHDITTVYSPTHDLQFDKREPRHVVAKYEIKNAIPATDFVTYYRAADEHVGATLMTYQPSGGEDGYFMMLAGPNPRNGRKIVQPKDVTLVIDHSGSMSGDKIEQAKKALKWILKNLNDRDRFNVISYNGTVEPFFDEMVKADKKNLQKALSLADDIEAMGGTNIAQALENALAHFGGKTESTDDEASRPAYVIFLTDGRPTVGITDHGKILKHVEDQNKSEARLFVLGVGYDVNISLLDKLAMDSGGVSDYVKEKEPLEQKVSGMYAKVKNPVMTDLAVSVEGVKLTQMYPRELPDLFEGSQLVVVGRYRTADVRDLRRRRSTLLIKGNYLGKPRAFEYNVPFCEPGQNLRDGHIERLWALRRIGFLLDEVQLHGKTDEVIDEIVRLSKRYGIMTPYTAFLADETDRLADSKHLNARAKLTARKMEQAQTGGAGQQHAGNRQMLKNADRAPTGAAVVSEATDGMGGPARRSNMNIGYSSVADYEEGKQRQTDLVLNIGNQTLYRRGKTWITLDTADLDEEKDAEKIEDLNRFSSKYFELVGKNTVEENQLLANQGDDEQLLVKLRGQVYRIR
ncbi:MAG: VIT domain-containing protein [Phycisphaerae bacterium]